MRSRHLVRFAFLVLVWAGIAAVTPVQPAWAQGTPIPNNVNATMARILATARKSWHADAIVTSVEMKWFPTDDLDAPGVMHWLEIQVNSPSTGARRYFYVGKPYDGTMVNEPPDHDGSTIDHALPAIINLDLPQALAYLRHAGLKDRLFFVKLEMVGAANTQPLAAWTIASLADPGLFPIVLDAQTGKIIKWERAYNPPPFTDKDIYAAWQKVLHPLKPGPNSAQQHLDCFMSVQEFGFCVN
jgi:hypothetical protein